MLCALSQAGHWGAGSGNPSPGALKPGGELRFYEHVIAHGPVPARLQRIADATFWPHVAGGCHMARDTLPAIERAGFTIERCERPGFTPGAPVPSIPHILGAARYVSPAA